MTNEICGLALLKQSSVCKMCQRERGKQRDDVRCVSKENSPQVIVDAEPCSKTPGSRTSYLECRAGKGRYETRQMVGTLDYDEDRHFRKGYLYA